MDIKIYTVHITETGNNGDDKWTEVNDSTQQQQHTHTKK